MVIWIHSTMETRNLILIIGISFTLVLGLIIGFTNYYEYKMLKQEQKYVDSVKAMQAELDRQFLELQQIKQEHLQSLNETIFLADEDNDGLTLAEELKLGTSDYNSDSDLDGVPDSADKHPGGGGITYTKTVEWFYRNYTITTQFGIPDDRYLWYKERPRMNATDPGYVTYNDLTMKYIAEDIADVAEIMNEECMYCVIVDFVQSMLYEFDVNYIGLDEYPKFPIETIVDERGDCEDTSYLLAALYKALGVDAVLVLFPGHMATAVACDDCGGAYYDYKGKEYYYVETTGTGWRIGEIPERLKGFRAYLVEI